MWTSQRLAETGRQAQLYCRASGNPPPTVTWYDPDEREIRPDDEQYKVEAASDCFECAHCAVLFYYVVTNKTSMCRHSYFVPIAGRLTSLASGK